MKLYTEREHGDYERRVDIYVGNSQNELPYINDNTTCKLLIVTSGNLIIEVEQEVYKFGRHSALFLSNRENIKVLDSSKFKATIVYFQPTAINDVLNYNDLYSGKYEDFDKNFGTTIYQDYRSVRNFLIKDGEQVKFCSLEESVYENVLNIIYKMKYELNEQYDGYWPCRSRSYFLELLFILNTRCEKDFHNLHDDSKVINRIIAHLNVHIDEKVTQEMIALAFNMDRNSLNKLFNENVGMTCMMYLEKLRLDLAKMMLTDTELPIAEIARRVSYNDQNYFSRVFKKECGMTPTKYRALNS